MGLFDFIVNVAGLLLWFNWRATRIGSPAKTSPVTLAGMFRRAAPSRFRRWVFVAALAGLIGARTLFYHMLGPAADWTASLDLGAVTLFFRSDRFWLMLLFSVLSFGRALVVVYGWLLAVAMVNRHSEFLNPVAAQLRNQLGRVATYPLYVQLVLPFLLAAVAWQVLHPALAYCGVTNPVSSYGALALQSLLVGLGPYLSLKYFIPPLLCVELIAQYIYFGSNPGWDFLGATARNLLAPLRRIPLRIGKVDCAPVAAIVLVILLLHTLPHLVIAELNKRHLTIWPQ